MQQTQHDPMISLLSDESKSGKLEKELKNKKNNRRGYAPRK